MMRTEPKTRVRTVAGPRRPLLLSALLVVTGVAGVASAGEDPVGSVSAYVGQADPLPTIPTTLWEQGPAGCEGLLGGLNDAVEWGVAEAAPDLVVASVDGCIICVDSFSSVESELELTRELDQLWHRYVASLQELEPLSAETYADLDIRGEASGDPHPTPSRPFDHFELGTLAGDQRLDPSPPVSLTPPDEGSASGAEREGSAAETPQRDR